MNCEELKSEALNAYIDGSLPSQTSDEVRDHLEQCASCRREEQIVRSLLLDLSTSESLEESKDIWPAIRDHIRKSDSLLSMLGESLARRQLLVANDLVGRNIYRIAELDPSLPYAAALLYQFAEWLHLTGSAHIEAAGYSNLTLLKSTYRRFPTVRRNLNLLDCVYLRMIAGIIALHTEQYDAAIRHFGFVLATDSELFGGPGAADDLDLLALANHSVGHALRRKGEYAKSLIYTQEAINIAKRSGREEMATAFLVAKGWILFKLMRPAEAEKLLMSLEPNLQKNGDHLSLGNLKAALAKLRERQGYLEPSMELQRLAIADFEKCDHNHKNIARALVNIAFLQHLLILKLLAQHGHHADSTVKSLRQEAVHNLDRAEVIYQSRHDCRGRGATSMVRALIIKAEGRFDESNRLAKEAHVIGLHNRDYVLIARSRILLCKIEHAKKSAARGDSNLSGAITMGEDTRQLAQEAVDAAERTQDFRLIAHSYIWFGIVLLDALEPDVEEARKCYEKSSSLLQPYLEGTLHDDDGFLTWDSLSNKDLRKHISSVQRRKATDWLFDELAILDKELVLAGKATETANPISTSHLEIER